MDDRSEKCLAGVHADLAKVIRAASQHPQPFIVVQGLRTGAQQAAALASGHSTTLHSRHLPHPLDGLSRAVDVVAMTGGKVDYAAGHEEKVFGAIADQIKIAAHELGIPVEWGGDWRKFRDYAHLQLPWKQYP